MTAQPTLPEPSFPALYLSPLDEPLFETRCISLGSAAGQRAVVGRHCSDNADRLQNERNGYFDFKVLSRFHAEVWAQDGQVYVKDTKSMNGTFVNGVRLSPECKDSEPFVLKTGDTVVRTPASMLLSQR